MIAMMKNRHADWIKPWRAGLSTLVLFGLCAFADAETAVGTAFTYQGYLAQSGGSANGSFDLRFMLYNAATGGSQVGGTLTLEDVALTQGRFSVTLDFGAGRFTGNNRWLEIAVRPGASTGSYTTLSPRQLLQPTPYALYALSVKSVPWSSVTGLPSWLADGDNDTTYTAGAGLDLTNRSFSVVFAGSGALNTVSRSDHNHSSYYLKTEADSRFVNTTGPESISGSNSSPILTVTQTGKGAAGKFVGKLALVADGATSLTRTLDVGNTVTAQVFHYRNPRVHYVTLSGEAFLPGSNVAYHNSGGMGGAYLVSGAGMMSAPLQLPDRARLTGFKVFFYKNSSSTLNVSLERMPLPNGAYTEIAEITSAGVTNYAAKSVSIPSGSIYKIVDNANYGYLIYAYSSSWDSYNLRVMGAQVTYEIDEVE